MREIKFRAWDKKNKKMISHEKLFSIDCSNEFPFLPLLKNMYSENLDVEIMQYTGMHDSTGKEVYEGDIVKVKDRGTEAIFEIRWRQEGEPMWILYPNTKERWCLHCIEINGEYRDNGVTVIGNRWDNQELLGVEVSAMKDRMAEMEARG